MRKIIIIILSFLLFNLFLCINNVSAEEMPDISKDVYFENLRNNFGYNSYGTCGYVALEMMLLYYDTFINDNIVDDKYEVNTNIITNSPGSYNDYDDVINTTMRYGDYINSLKDISLHAYLIYLGINYFDYGYSISNSQQIALLEYYLENVAGLVKNLDFSINHIDSQSNSNIKTWIISKILDDEIVLTSISDIQYGSGGAIFENSSHSLISYEIVIMRYT